MPRFLEKLKFTLGQDWEDPAYTDRLKALVKVAEEGFESGEFTLSTNGHFRVRSEKNLLDYLLEDLLSIHRIYPPADKDLRETFQGNNPISFTSLLAGECPGCGKKFEWTFDGKKFFLDGDPCTVKDYNFDVELNVPSGELVFANDFRSLFHIYDNWEVNHYYGSKQYSRSYEDAGLALLNVGNSCPDICLDPKGDLVIGNFEMFDEDGYEEGLPEGYQKFGYICTDLWWYSAIDSDLYKLKLDGEKDDKGLVRVQVEPGVYRFHHCFNELGFQMGNNSERGTYTSITKIREPDPVKDYLRIDAEKDLTAEQAISSMIELPWFGNSPLRVIDHICMTTGNAIKWHPNGFPIVKDYSGSVEIPSLCRKYDWYPLSKFSALSKAAHGEINLNESFQDLMLNIASSITKYGSSGPHSEETRSVTKECLGLLMERYPERVLDSHREAFNIV